LKALSDADIALLTPCLTAEPLPVRKTLEAPHKPIQTIYFMDQGIASVVAMTEKDVEVEVGLVGCEGVTGLAVILGSDRTPHHTYIQIAGAGFSMRAADLLRVMDENATLRRLLLRYAQAFTIQATHTAAANARATIEARLARWILMAHDRVPHNEMRLTHEFLSVMLGVRRAGVTVTIQALMRQGAIQSPKSGLIVMVDREGLKGIAGSFYGVPEREYDRLIAPKK
jgi:CRP-like cAMP-binding protein